MKALTEHPVHIETQEYYDRVRQEGFIGKKRPEQFQLGVHLKYLLELDPRAVFLIRGNSTVVYYTSQFAREKEGIARIVLDPQGNHRRIDTVYFDPR